MFRVFIDGRQPMAVMWTTKTMGSSVNSALYQLIRQSGPITDGQFEVAFLGSGVEAFAFTFGSRNASRHL